MKSTADQSRMRTWLASPTSSGVRTDGIVQSATRHDTSASSNARWAGIQKRSRERPPRPRLQPPGVGRRPSGIGRPAELVGPLSSSRKSPRATSANAGGVRAADLRGEALHFLRLNGVF